MLWGKLIPPIKMYNIRSRLEARWAITFDELDLQYEYEQEGFEMESGVRYLPDFYLIDLGIYCEMKPPKDIT